MVVGTIIKPRAADFVPSIPVKDPEKFVKVFTTSIVKNEENAGNTAPVNARCLASNPENKGNKYCVNSIQGVEEEREQEEQSTSRAPN
eukprot:970555-Lingulodinium_polyedra.AAC.1